MSTFKTFKEVATENIEIVNDAFVNATGEWNNYVCYPSTNGDGSQNDQISKQKHTDIRSFHNGKKTKRGISFLTKSTMAELGLILCNTTYPDLIGSSTLIASENWQGTNLTVGLQSDRNNWNGISAVCSSNATKTFYSISPSKIDLSSYDDTSLAGDYITISCPVLPPLKKSLSSIDFTSEVGFASANTDVINLSNSDLTYKSNKIDKIKNYSSLKTYWRLEETNITSVNDEINNLINVRVATTGSESYNINYGPVSSIAGTTIDSITLNVGDIILIKNAGIPTDSNGYYTVSGSGSATTSSSSCANGVYAVTAILNGNMLVSRTVEMLSWNQLQNAYLVVSEGTNQNVFWITDSIGSGTTDTTPVTFIKNYVEIKDEFDVSNGELRGSITSTNLDQTGVFSSSASIYFDGTSNYIKIPYTSDINPTESSFTVSVWCKPDFANLTAGLTTPGIDLRLISNEGYTTGYGLGINSFTKKPFFIHSGGTLSTNTGTNQTVTDNAWNLITAVFSTTGAGVSLYVNGVIARNPGTSTIKPNAKITNLKITTTAGSTSATLSDTTGLTTNQTYSITSSTIYQGTPTTFTTSGTLSKSITLSSSAGLSTGTSDAIIQTGFGFYIGGLLPSGATANDKKLFKGNIDEISIFNTALTATQILDIYDTCKPAIDENVEIQIPLKLLNKSTYTKNLANETISDTIKGVKFNINNSTGSNFNFRCLAMRCVSKDWIYSPIDLQTQLETIGLQPTTNGSALTSVVSSNFTNWPTNTNSSNLPTLWPALFRSYENNPSTFDVPDPIDGKMQVTFNTGSVSNASSTNSNEFNIYFRATTKGVTNTYLNTKMQTELDAIGDIENVLEDLEKYRQKDHSIIQGKLPITRSTPTPTSVAELLRTSPTSDFQTTPVSTTLAQDLSSTETTSIILSNASSFPNSGIVYIKSQYPEYIKYSSKSGNTLSIATNGRGQYNTVAAAHTTSSPASSPAHLFNQLNLTSPAYANTSGKTQRTMNTKTQYELSYYIDVNKISYATAKFIWWKESGNIKSKIQIYTETGSAAGYTFSLPDNLIEINTVYAIMPEINNYTLRVKIYKLTNVTSETYVYNDMILVYDTGIVNNLFIINHKGRVGWSAKLVDGDAYMESVRSHGLVYAKLLSKPIQSYTPVKGIQAAIQNTPPIELYSSIDESPFNRVNSYFMAENKRVAANSTSSYKVFNSEGNLQGLKTNDFEIEDFEDIKIEFNLYKQLASQRISVYLYQKERDVIMPFYTPDVIEGSWQNIKFELTNDFHPSGIYSLLIVEDNAQSGSTWWVDNITIQKKTMHWSARSYSNGINEIGADDWLTIDPIINGSSSGAQFATSGKELQIQGLAKSQTAAITELNYIPKYATLGNLKNYA